MKQLNIFMTEALITESSKWSTSKNINNILIQALGEKSNWSENPRKWLTAMGSTFTEWYNDGDELKWWASDDRYESTIEVTNDDNIYDISYGNIVYEDDRYMNPCTIYTTKSFWGVEFYDNVIVCSKNNKTLNDLSKEVANAKQKAIKDREKQEEEFKKQAIDRFNEEWKLYVLSNDRDNPKYKKLQKYKGKVCKVKLSWAGFDEEYTFIAILTGLEYEYSPQFSLPLTSDYKVIPNNNDHNYDSAEDFYNNSETFGTIYMSPYNEIIVKDIEEVSESNRKKYLKIVGKELDKHENKATWFNVIHDNLVK